MLKEESTVARKTIKDHMLSNVFNLTWMKFSIKWSIFTVQQCRNTKSIERETEENGQIDTATDIGGRDERYYREVKLDFRDKKC